ncbi:hypothetical protein ACFHYQ_25615 [Sphaerimonospora cavernae]|uniref:Uncharacterized protein n=1 Tax=Sphaerimonospora cavernae TaxID=1740611 RepID=A0ABV6UBV6_9ACTN
MNNPSSQPYIWLLVAILTSLVIALITALLKTKDGAKTTTMITAAGIAFGSTMTVCMTTLVAMRLL